MSDRVAGSRIGARRFERLLETIVGVFGLLYALQTLDSLLAGFASTQGSGLVWLTVVIAVAVTLGLAAAVLRRIARQLFLVAFLLYVVALLIGQTVLHGPLPVSPMPWLIALWPVPCAYLITAVRSWVLPLAVGAAVAARDVVVLSTRGGFGLADAALAGGFVLAVTVVLVVLLHGVRRGVASADSAQQTALVRYADSTLDDAVESERVRTDALVHDSVLTTFLSAAQAFDPASEALAVRMAQNALRVLAHVAESAMHGPRVPLSQTLAAAEPDLEPLRQHVDLVVRDVQTLMLPEHVAEAMVTAMTQAMTNSVKHAGSGVARSAVLEPYGIDGLRIVVEDDGVGFDPSGVSAERLGVRVSILERVQRVDGTAVITSTPGEGTRVELCYGTVLDAVPAGEPRTDAVPVIA